MEDKCKAFSRSFQAQVVLEAIDKEQSVEDIAQKYMLKQETVMKWTEAYLRTMGIASQGEQTERELVQLFDHADSYEYILSKMVLDNTPNLVDVVDVNTYEVLYVNLASKEAYGIENVDYRGKKCYNLFYGLDAPCDFCPTSNLRNGQSYEWKGYTAKNQRFYQMSDRLLKLDNRDVRMEVGVDIDENENKIHALDNRVAMDGVTFECIRTLTAAEDLQQAVERILEIVCTYYEGDRGYIFECSPEHSVVKNTYEWCPPEKPSKKEDQQAISAEALIEWFDHFRVNGGLFITNENNELDPNDSYYKMLEEQEVGSLMVAPLVEDREIKGFIGVDNPKAWINDFNLLSSVTYFVVNDIQKRRMVQELTRMSYVDILTQLFNRNKFLKRMEELEKFPTKSIGVVYLDLNGLKVANDQFGHGYGDHLLKQMAGIILDNFNSDESYRIGGDEFVMLEIDGTKDEFEKQVEKLRNDVDAVPEFSASIGSTWEAGNYNINTMVKHADDLMYANKQRYYDSALVRDYNQKSAMAKRLLMDLQNGKYMVYLQPQISVLTGKVYGAEALIRGTDKDGNILYPDSFIPVCEAHGNIRHIDFYVLETVCKLLHKLELQGKQLGSVSVNFSRTTLIEYDVVTQMLAVCQKYQISPANITIEVTESAAKLLVEEMGELISKIKAAGFSTALDDFGAKYSNMAILCEIGFDEIKLDQTIVGRLASNEKTRIMAQHTIQMLKAMEMSRITAEGIETSAELELIREYGCDSVQGYFFSRPIPVDEFVEQYLQ